MANAVTATERSLGSAWKEKVLWRSSISAFWSTSDDLYNQWNDLGLRKRKNWQLKAEYLSASDIVEWRRTVLARLKNKIYAGSLKCTLSAKCCCCSIGIISYNRTTPTAVIKDQFNHSRAKDGKTIFLLQSFFTLKDLLLAIPFLPSAAKIFCFCTRFVNDVFTMSILLTAFI